MMSEKERSDHRVLMAAGFGPNGAFDCASDDWLAALTRSADVAACVIEILHDAEHGDHRFIAVSPAFESATGLHDVVGRTMRELRPAHESYWFELYERVAITGVPISFEHSARALDRRFRGFAFRIGAPHAWQVVVIFEDCSRSAEHFEPESSETRDVPLEHFGATLAHELRGPLAPIGNGLRILDTLAGDQAPIRSTLEMMARQFAQLTGLIDGLLDLGRLGSSNLRLERRRVELHHAISDSIEACVTLIHARQHDVTIDSDGARLAVQGDLRRLTQVFTNLLTNSIKYTPPGGHIRIRLGSADGMAIVEVQDDGIGMRAEDLPRAFELFTQSPEHRCQADGGLGIGLAVVRNVVRLHEGTVCAHSDGAGRGSTFTVRLPLSHD